MKQKYLIPFFEINLVLVMAPITWIISNDFLCSISNALAKNPASSPRNKCCGNQFFNIDSFNALVHTSRHCELVPRGCVLIGNSLQDVSERISQVCEIVISATRSAGL